MDQEFRERESRCDIIFIGIEAETKRMFNEINRERSINELRKHGMVLKFDTLS